jgi:ribosome recycling factor
VEEEVLAEFGSKMQKAVTGLVQQLVTIRTGRATPALVKSIQTEYHGALVPIEQIASITVPEPNLISIRPWERSSIKSIEKAILKDDIGLNPSNDGTVVRVIIPPLSEERRIELAKLVAKRVEERRVVLRNIRRDIVTKFRELEKEKEISQDQLRNIIKKIDDICDTFIEQVDKIGLEKEKEIKEV